VVRTLLSHPMRLPTSAAASIGKPFDDCLAVGCLSVSSLAVENSADGREISFRRSMGVLPPLSGPQSPFFFPLSSPLLSYRRN